MTFINWCNIIWILNVMVWIEIFFNIYSMHHMIFRCQIPSISWKWIEWKIWLWPWKNTRNWYKLVFHIYSKAFKNSIGNETFPNGCLQLQKLFQGWMDYLEHDFVIKAASQKYKVAPYWSLMANIWNQGCSCSPQLTVYVAELICLII